LEYCSARSPAGSTSFFYIYDLPAIFNNSVKSVLFADDTSLIVSSDNNLQHRNEVNNSFTYLNAWFISGLTLNFNKTKHVQFVTMFSSNSETLVTYHNNAILSSSSAKFLGIVIESSCTWKAHISQLMPKLCKACYSVRVIKPIMPSVTLKMAFYSYFHSLLFFGIIFGAIPLIVCTSIELKKKSLEL
jgi:hypothetical protein